MTLIYQLISPPETELIISGGASGVDSIAENYADSHRISKLIVRPNYKRFGKAAPLRRNETMVKIADKILIIWDGVSHGASYTLHYAKKIGKPICLITKPHNYGVSPKVKITFSKRKAGLERHSKGQFPEIRYISKGICRILYLCSQMQCLSGKLTSHR